MKWSNVLISGGTGTFGRAFAKQCLADGARRICIYSRDELKQAEMRAELNDERLRFFIGDVRDKDRLRLALENVNMVVHAAALKRVEVGEYDAGEMVKTNVVGTMNLIEAAHDAKVKKVIALSTDKAEEPVNAYGASKLLMEKLLMVDYLSPEFSVLRCGNFFGSRGSVLDIWKPLIAAGKKVPLTDKRCTRFMMTVQQAVDLVKIMSQQHHALIIPKGLKAFRPVDLAAVLGADYYITGLGPGERLHEILDGKSSADAEFMTIKQLKYLCSSPAS